MKVKDLKKAIEKMTDENEVILVGYDRKTGKSTFQEIHQCCNYEHQEKVNELWLSDEGFKLDR